MKSLYDTTSPACGLRALGLTETRFPLQTRTQVPAISNLWKKAKTMNWDPDDIAYATFDRSRYSQEQLDAARLCWSRRAWTEYTGIIESPAMCIRMSLDGKLPIEAKFVRFTVSATDRGSSSSDAPRYWELSGGTSAG